MTPEPIRLPVSVLKLDPDVVVSWKAARRVEYAIEVISRLQEFWVLEGTEGWAENETGALQVWPGQWFAARTAGGDRQGMMPGFVGPEDWEGLDEDYETVDVFPTPEQDGVVVQTAGFLEQLRDGPLTKLLTPDRSERVWAEPLEQPGRFRLRTTPWYAPGLVFGDGVEARDDGADIPVIVGRTAAGGHRAERFLFASTLGPAARAKLLADLSAAGGAPDTGGGDLVVANLADEQVVERVERILAEAEAEDAVERGDVDTSESFLARCRQGARSVGRVVQHAGAAEAVVLADIREHELADEDWEALPVERDGDGWRVAAAPFYAYDVAPGDIVEASARPEHLLVLQSVLRRGEHGVLRVVTHTDSGRDAVLALARRSGLAVEQATHANLIAIDLPTADAAPDVMQALEDLQNIGAVGYETGWS